MIQQPSQRQILRAAGAMSLAGAAVELNVRWLMHQLSQLPEGRKAIEDKLVTLAGAIYDLNTGRVRFLT
jgi:carbonic anhydrase